MNVDTGQLGTLDELLKAAKPGERVIPATLIGLPGAVGGILQAAGRWDRDEARRRFIERNNAAAKVTMAAVYGPRKPLREVRAELRAQKAAEAQP
jgi:hypothetical protein